MGVFQFRAVHLDQGNIYKEEWQRDGDVSFLEKTFEPGEALFLMWGGKVDCENRVSSRIRQKRVTEIEGEWEFSTDRANILVINDWRVNVSRNQQRIEAEFHSKIPLKRAKLILDIEMSIPELEAGHFSKRLRCYLNGREVSGFKWGTYIDRYILEAEVGELIQIGENKIVMEIGATLAGCEYLSWPMMIVGEFGVIKEREKWHLISSPKRINTGSWVSEGYPFFCGEGIYFKKIKLPDMGRKEKMFLEIKEVKHICEVLVNGVSLGVRISPPFIFDLSPFRDKKQIELTVRVTNTPYNLFFNDKKPAGLTGAVKLIVVESKDK